MDVCNKWISLFDASTFLSIYSVKQCITLHKNSGRAGAKTGRGLSPLAP